MRCPSVASALSLALALTLLPAAAQPAQVLDVSGGVVATEPRLRIRVALKNRGAARAGPIEVRGELFGETATASLAGGLASGAEGAVTLDFTPAASRAGLHALPLLLEHPVEGASDAAGNPPMASERGFLQLALGASPGEAVRLAAEPLRLDVRGSMRVRLESRDGEPHRVSLHTLTARGLRAEGGPIEVAVPASGRVTAEVEIARAGAARGDRQVLLLVAETLDGALARTAVAAATVELLPDPALLPRLRLPLLALGMVLLALALGYEARTRLRARTAPPA